MFASASGMKAPPAQVHQLVIAEARPHPAHPNEHDHERKQFRPQEDSRCAESRRAIAFAGVREAGSVQPPKNSVTIIAELAIMFAYSPRKNSANFIELYSV